MNRFVLGLTGGIASGKSMAADIFKENGAAIVDADIVSRKVMSDGKIISQIGKKFPGSVKSGVIDRAELRRQAFASPANTLKLNGITHPAILEECKKMLDAADGFIVFVVPLLFETGANKFCDATLTVSCPKKIRIERLIKRDNIDRELAEKIMSRQNTDSQREKASDYVIVNDVSPEELKKNVLFLMGELKKNQ